MISTARPAAGRAIAARLAEETQDSHGQPAGRECRADHPADEGGLYDRTADTEYDCRCLVSVIGKENG